MLRKINYGGNMKNILNNLNSRKEGINKNVNETVEKILKDVKINGDEALIKYAKEFDGFVINDIKDIIVTKNEIEQGVKSVGENFIRILNRAKKQITEFHVNQIDKSWSIYKENGVMMGQLVRPLKRIAVYHSIFLYKHL